MEVAEYVDKVFAHVATANTGSIPQSKILDVFQGTLKAKGSDKVVNQAEIDAALAKITVSNPTTITKAEFIELIEKSKP